MLKLPVVSLHREEGGGSKRQECQTDGNHCCSQPNIWWNISALETLQNFVNPAGHGCYLEEFHQVEARAHKALAEDSWVSLRPRNTGKFLSAQSRTLFFLGGG